VRTIHWLFVVSLALFIVGVAFVVAAGRSPRETVSRVEPAPTVPVASIKQIMNAIVQPSAVAIFGAVSSTITKDGTEEKAPHSDAEWDAVRNNAAALAESGNLLMIAGRSIDKGDWVKMSKAMIDAARLTMKATDEKSPQGVFDSGEFIYDSCNNCHGKYQRGG
jgi:hypothetical protein